MFSRLHPGLEAKKIDVNNNEEIFLKQKRLFEIQKTKQTGKHKT